MPTSITNNFKEIYGNNGPLGKRNASPNNMLKNIVPNREFTNNTTSNYNKSMNNPITEDIKEPFKIPYLLIFLFLLSVVIIILLYINRDNITLFINNTLMAKKDETVKEEPVNNLPVQEEPVQEEKKQEEPVQEEKKLESPIEEDKTIKEKEKKENNKYSQIKQGGVNVLNETLNKNYRPEQIVKENGYCYIGYENGQRECTNVFEGEICMSGEIFPKLDICINPNLRP
jgi:hypothetical protein